MPNMFQIRTVHSGFTGAPGYTQHYFDASGSSLGAQSASDAIRAFWETFAASMPSGWHYAIDADVETIDDSTGDLIGVTSTTPLVQSVTGATAAYAGGTGACITWVTNSVHFTRRLKGRTFVVPLSTSNYESDGTLTNGVLTQLRSAAAALIGHADFGVWGRPVDGTDGLFANATAYNVRDKAAVLRSRRD
jgi:hypothetical protein